MKKADTTYFNEVASRWDELRDGFFSDAVRDKALESVGVRAGQQAADVGAGTGFVTEALMARGVEVVAIDPSPAMLAEMEEKLGESEEIRYRVGRAEDLPLHNEEVDYVFANMCLHHVDSPPQALREMARVLRPRGQVVITDLDEHDYEFLRTEHYDRWMGFKRGDVVRWLEEAGLRDISVASLNEGCCATSSCGSEEASVSIFIALGAKAKGPDSGCPDGSPNFSQPVERKLAETRYQVREAVRERYAGAAKQAASAGASYCGPAEGSCCGKSALAEGEREVFGASQYGEDEREELPEAAGLASLGCGNPTAVAELREGETVLDLGSGGGIDVLLSARRVGTTGFAYGLDMTDEMLALARRNAEEAGAENVEFLRGDIEAIPLPDASVDVVISNCVVNLSADKARVLSEVGRILRPGGRVGISDVVADPEMDEDTRRDMDAFTGCIAGALTREEYEAGLRAAGLVDIEVRETHRVHEHAGSAVIRAWKPLHS